MLVVTGPQDLRLTVTTCLRHYTCVWHDRRFSCERDTGFRPAYQLRKRSVCQLVGVRVKKKKKSNLKHVTLEVMSHLCLRERVSEWRDDDYEDEKMLDV